MFCINISAKKVINILKENGEVICDDGDELNKGGLTIEKINNMTKEEREKLSPYFLKSCQIADKRDSHNLKRYEAMKEVSVFYIKGSFDCGSCSFIINLINNYNLAYSIIRFSENFWLGMFEGEAKIAIYAHFDYRYVPYNEFKILVSIIRQYKFIKIFKNLII